MKALLFALVGLTAWLLAVVLFLDAVRPEPASDLRERARDLSPVAAGREPVPFAVTAGDFAP